MIIRATKPPDVLWATDAVKYCFYCKQIECHLIDNLNIEFGGQKYEDMQFTSRNCTVIEGIQCYGPQNFMKPNFPCVRYMSNDYRFQSNYSTLVNSCFQIFWSLFCDHITLLIVIRLSGNGSLLFRPYGDCCRKTIDVRRSRHLVDRRHCPLSYRTFNSRRRQSMDA